MAEFVCTFMDRNMEVIGERIVSADDLAQALVCCAAAMFRGDAGAAAGVIVEPGYNHG